jgi:uncharacterized protein YggE
VRISNHIRAAVIGVALFAAAPLPAQVGGTSKPAQVVTIGIGEARVAPDRATIFIGVQSRGATASIAAADNARRQRAILDTLRSLGFGGDLLSTMNYNVSPEMQYNPNNQPPRVTGYVVTNTVRVEVRKLDEVARAIDASLAKGANEISGLQFFSSKADSVRRTALALAVANARSDAEALARAAGGTLGPLLELSSSFPVGGPQEFRGMTAMAARAPTPIEPGQQTISANVLARWQFLVR